MFGFSNAVSYNLRHLKILPISAHCPVDYKRTKEVTENVFRMVYSFNITFLGGQIYYFKLTVNSINLIIRKIASLSADSTVKMKVL